jgi:MEMO1 family protein
LSFRTRPPAVAGYFYPSDSEELVRELRRCFSDKKIGPGIDFAQRPNQEKEESHEQHTECFVVPHAGYIYSGPVAAHSFNKANDLLISKSEKVTAIILGPNHYGIGSGVAISPSSEWETPLGKVKLDQDLSHSIAGFSQLIDIDGIAHSREHSIEVQIPFLQFLCQEKSLEIVPICLMMQDKETADEVSEAIYRAVSSRENQRAPLLIFGSSDLTHYEPASKASYHDGKLLEKVSKMDITSYYSVLERLNVTACGYGAIAIAMSVAKKLHRDEGKLLKYATSGDVTGDQNSVVGYSAVHFV